MLDGNRLAMMQQAQKQVQEAQTYEIVRICVELSTNRDNMCGANGSATSNSIVVAADKFILAWLNGLSTARGD